VAGVDPPSDHLNRCDGEGTQSNHEVGAAWPGSQALLDDLAGEQRDQHKQRKHLPALQAETAPAIDPGIGQHGEDHNQERDSTYDDPLPAAAQRQRGAQQR
jgi:hypothetical protein